MFRIIRGVSALPRTRRLGITIATTLAVTAPLMMFAIPPAYAAASSCGGDVCAVTSARKIAVTATVRAYPPNYTFNGHFQLQTPNGKVFNSKTATWNQNGTGYHFKNIHGGRGRWCVTAWRPAVGGGWEKIGNTCIPT